MAEQDITRPITSSQLRIVLERGHPKHEKVHANVAFIRAHNRVVDWSSGDYADHLANGFEVHFARTRLVGEGGSWSKTLQSIVEEACKHHDVAYPNDLQIGFWAGILSDMLDRP